MTQTLESFGESTRRSIARISKRFGGVAFGELTAEQLANAVKNCGVAGVAFIWHQSEQHVREQLARLRSEQRGEPVRVSKPRSAERATRAAAPVLDLMHALQQSLAKSKTAAPSPLVDDAHLAVPLQTLAPGSRFKTPDSPSEGLRGRVGVLLYANDARARVRFETSPRTFTAKRADKDGNEHDVELTFERSGEIDIAARTPAVPLPTEG